MILDKDQLWQLRNQISLNSMYYADYRNNFGIERHACCDFFDGFLDFIENEMKEDIDGYDDREFFKYLEDYDNADYLWEWYMCFEYDCLPIDKDWVAGKLKEELEDTIDELMTQDDWSEKSDDEKYTAILDPINAKIAEFEEDYPELKEEDKDDYRWYDGARDKLLWGYTD